MAHLLSVNVGLPRDIAWQGKTVHTAIWKAPVQGRRTAVWEKIFDPKDCKCAPIRDALTARRLEGFICAAGFRTEAIENRDRAAYFAEPYVDCLFEGIDMRDGVPYAKMSSGPDNTRHPGLHRVPAGKLQSALATGIRLMRGLNWTILPEPQEILDPKIYVLDP